MHVYRTSMQKDGFKPMNDLVDTPTLTDHRATRDDVRRIVRGDGGNDKRFEMGLTNDGVTNAIRAAQGHSFRSGVIEDVLPVAEYMETLIHGATLDAAKRIVEEGIARQDRLRVHLWGSDMKGRPLVRRNKLRASSEAAAVVSSERCGRYGIVFIAHPMARL